MIQIKKYIPEAFKSLRIWILWRLEKIEGRETKVPYSPLYRGKASSTKADTWGSYEEAITALAGYGSAFRLGIMISEGIIFLDCDHCIIDGEPDERARDILSAFEGQFVEVSQSGTGLHAFAFGQIPKSFKNSHNGVEMYSGSRFCALTGDAVSPCEPHSGQTVIDYCFTKYKRQEAERKAHKCPSAPLQREDQWIIERASSRGGKFPSLWAGDWSDYPSRSDADSALCMILAFWTDADPERIDSLFRSSGLYREKWERASYREPTIQNAIDHCRETLSEFIERSKREEASDYVREYLDQW